MDEVRITEVGIDRYLVEFMTVPDDEYLAVGNILWYLEGWRLVFSRDALSFRIGNVTLQILADAVRKLNEGCMYVPHNQGS